ISVSDAVPDMAVHDSESVSEPDATATGALPKFVDKPDAGAARPFLTSLAHLYGQTVGGVPLPPNQDIQIVNPGPSGADVIVTAQLQNYSAPATVGLHVKANG